MSDSSLERYSVGLLHRHFIDFFLHRKVSKRQNNARMSLWKGTWLDITTHACLFEATDLHTDPIILFIGLLYLHFILLFCASGICKVKILAA
jgi:hypothetical protein